MSRPTPNILYTTRDEDSVQWDILEGDLLYVVVYDNRFINVRRHVQTLYTSGYKYFKLSYVNRASANNTAKKLNKIFQTTLFTVKQVS